MNKNLISIILPVFNPKIAHLNEAIESICSQTYKNFECIFVYDDPKFDITNLLESFTNKDPRFKIIYGDNQGLVAALNKGIELCSGNFIARMDADDVCMSKRLELQIEYIEKNKLDIIGGHYYIINDDGVYISARVVPIQHEEISLLLSKTVPFAHSSVLFRKDFINRHSLSYSSKISNFSEDYQLWVDMFEYGAIFGNLPEWILKYRISETSLSQRMLSASIKNSKIISSKYIHNNRAELEELLIMWNKFEIGMEVKEVLVYLSLRLAFEYGCYRPIFSLGKLGRKSLVMGFMRFIASKF